MSQKRLDNLCVKLLAKLQNEKLVADGVTVGMVSDVIASLAPARDKFDAGINYVVDILCGDRTATAVVEALTPPDVDTPPGTKFAVIAKCLFALHPGSEVSQRIIGGEMASIVESLAALDEDTRGEIFALWCHGCGQAKPMGSECFCDPIHEI